MKEKNRRTRKQVRDEKAGRFERESQWQARVHQIFRVNGLLAYHTVDSRRSQPGFPDCVAVDPGDASGEPRLIIAELKVKGKPSTEQERWLGALRRVAKAVNMACRPVLGYSPLVVALWWPVDEEEVIRVSGGKRPL